MIFAFSMKIPSKFQCYRMMVKMAMLDNIVAHSIRVCQVAMLLTDKLNSNGGALDVELIRAAALLHDITKTRSLATRENHARTGDLYLRGQGYPMVGKIVGQHVKISDFHPVSRPTAAEVVNYADKRVLHDKVVSLEERMAYIVERYCCSGELGHQRLDKLRQASQVIEDKLFATMPFSAGELSDHLVPENFKNDMADFQQTVRDFLNTPI
jgi:putative nucleotidyltransferase with HDIG domain